MRPFSFLSSKFAHFQAAFFSSPPEQASGARDNRRERVRDGVVGHIAVVLDQPARSIEVVDDVGLVFVGEPGAFSGRLATSAVLRGPLRPMPPNSSEASPISLVLSPASRDMIEYALPTTVSWAEKVETNGPLTICFGDHVSEKPGASHGRCPG